MAFPSLRAKLSLAAWLEVHTEFRLPSHGKNLSEALDSLKQEPLNDSSYLDQFCNLKRYFNRGILALLFVCSVLGLMAVPPAFAINQGNQVNIFWLLIVLLGFHAINLIVWSVTMMATASYTGGGKGILLNSLIFIIEKVSKHSHIKTKVSDAFFHWQCPTQSNKWLVSSISHAVWSCYLLAGWMTTLLLLLTNQVDFIWETTLLSDDAFIQLTQTLSIIPQWFGLSLPNQFDILASRIDLVSQEVSTRQHWANFLLASIMIYGVFPRLILTLFSMSMYHLKRSTQPLSTQERFIQNRYQYKEKHSTIVVDNDLNQPFKSANTSHNDKVNMLNSSAFLQRWALFEWSTPQPSFLNKASTLSLLNSREEQTRFLIDTNPTPVYILVDATQSPDRGSRRFFTQVGESYSSAFIAILGDEEAHFIEDWQRLAKEAQLPFTQIVEKD